jgi:hypothetical protein
MVASQTSTALRPASTPLPNVTRVFQRHVEQVPIISFIGLNIIGLNTDLVILQDLIDFSNK